MSVQVPTRYRNFNAISNDVEYESPQKYYPGQPLGKNFDYKPYKPQVYYPANWSNQQYNQQNDLYNSVDSNNQYNAVPTQQQPQQEVRQLIVVYQG